MKKQIIQFITLLFSLSVLAQEDGPDYKQFERLARRINDIHQASHGKKLKTETMDAALNIPEANFIFNYRDLSASLIYGSGKQMENFEHLDLAGTKSVYWINDKLGDLGMIALAFSNNQNITIINEGKVIQKNIDVIPLYFPFSEKSKGEEMFNALSDLIYLTKIKKGLITAEEAERQKTQWKETARKDMPAFYYDYWKKEPDNNIFKQLAYYRVELLDRSLKLEKLNTGNFYLGMTGTDFSNVLKTRVREYPSHDNKDLREAQQNYYFQYKADGIEGMYEADLSIEKLYSVLGERKIRKNHEQLTDMDKFSKQSLGNDLFALFPEGSTATIDRAFFKKNQKLSGIWFLFQLKESADYVAVVQKIHEKYSAGSFAYSVTEGFYNTDGMGSKRITFLSPGNGIVKLEPDTAMVIFSEK